MFGKHFARCVERTRFHEASAPKHHWSDWYAAYIVARQEWKTPEEAATAGASTWKEFQAHRPKRPDTN